MRVTDELGARGEGHFYAGWGSTARSRSRALLSCEKMGPPKIKILGLGRNL
jgi:hypothetical protein